MYKVLQILTEETCSGFVVFTWYLGLLLQYNCWLVGWFMVFNATFNNISAILWRSVLLVEETRVTEENHQPVASH
jgi:hypothetical protein